MRGFAPAVVLVLLLPLCLSAAPTCKSDKDCVPELCCCTWSVRHRLQKPDRPCNKVCDCKVKPVRPSAVCKQGRCVAAFPKVLANKLSRQVLPVMVFFRAVHTGNLALFKSVYSSRMRAILLKRGWQRAFDGYRKSFAKYFPGYKPEDFSLVYKGRKSDGKVLITFKGTLSASLDVVEEHGAWKIDEL